MKKKLLIFSIVQFVIIAFALIMLFIPAVEALDNPKPDETPARFSAWLAFLEGFTDDDILLYIMMPYPICLFIASILVVLAGLKNIKFATQENVKIPKKKYKNIFLTFAFGIICWGFAIIFTRKWDNFATVQFLYMTLVYLVPSIVLLITDKNIKNTYILIRKERKKEKAAKAAAEAAATETEAVAEEK